MAKPRAGLQFVEPQLATLVETPPKGDDWLHEPKYDGYRTQLIVENGKARALTRRGADWSAKYRPIVAAAAALPDAILDGEIVAFDSEGRPTIEAFRTALSSEPGRLLFVAFDLLYLDGEDLRGMPQIERRARLAALLAGAGGAIQFSEHVTGGGQAFYDQACRLGLEGIVSKRPDAPYRSGRTEAWVKTKCYEESEFIVTGIQRERGKPSFAVMASLGDGRYVGSAFIALGRGDRDRLYELAEAGGGKAPAGYTVKKNFPAEWIKPRVTGRVLHLMREEPLRHARLVGIAAPAAVTRRTTR